MLPVIPQHHQLIPILLLSLAFFSPSSADWQYKSRPDLSPPILNITVPATREVSLGYIFVAPYSWLSWSTVPPFGPLQPAPYIFTSTGELVWSGFGYFSGWATNFQAARLSGEDVLFAFEGSRNTKHGHSHGHAKILNRNYETVREVRAGGHSVLDLHEFQIVDEKTALVEIYQPVPFDLQAYGAGPESQWLVDARFQEIEIKTGRLLFEWRSLDHVHPDESVTPVSELAFGTGHNSSDALDFFHINSVDRDAEHNYLISGRHTSTIYKINGTSGEILWRLGGKYSNFTLGAGVSFGFQHHARFLSKSSDGETETISIFDNSGHQTDRWSDSLPGKSSGKLLSLNTQTWTATLLQAFPAPDNLLASSQGSTQILPNGNALLNWGSAGAITEFSPRGAVVFHAYLDSGALWEKGDVQNYRAFRFNWTGIPREAIAVVALEHGESTMVYASWNGDTETSAWRFWGVDGEGRETALGREEKRGFETGFYVMSGADWVGFWAEAVGADGEALGRSAVAAKAKYIYQYVPGRDDFVVGGESQGVLASFET